MAGTATADGEPDEPSEFSFDHGYEAEASANRTSGLLNFLTGNDTIRQFRLVHSYEQTIRIQRTTTRFNLVKFSIDFTQAYEAESRQFIDSQALLNEIYHGVRFGQHEVRWGNQVFPLGKVDFGSPIDVLHVEDLFSLMTFEPGADQRKSLPSIKYDWLGDGRTVTFYAAPVGQRTFGMKFTRFREDSEKRDAGLQPEGELLLREYAGVQHEWQFSHLDLRLGFFHWFDHHPRTSWEFIQPAEGEEDTSFQGLYDTFREEESRTNFATLELDAVLGRIGWKLDLGVFDRKNFFDYQVTANDSVYFDTVSVPYLGLATSIEARVADALVLLAYGYQRLQDVPANTHVLLFENEAAAIPRERDLEQHSLTGVVLFRFAEEHRATLLVGRTAPFALTTYMAQWSLDRPRRERGAWSVRLLHLETDTQAISGLPIVSTQLSVGYTVFFSGLRSN